MLLQEIKTVDAGFPREMFEEPRLSRPSRCSRTGYAVEKGFNGVAILSKAPLEDVRRGLPGDESDEQARWIEATVMGEARALRVCGLYLPNGNPAPGPKYDYKLAWMERLQDRAADLMATEEPVLMGGDYNVIPQDEDAARPEAWRKGRARAAREPRGVPPPAASRAHRGGARPRAGAGPLHLLGLSGRRVGPQ